jgi:hypothetical protein
MFLHPFIHPASLLPFACIHLPLFCYWNFLLV